MSPILLKYFLIKNPQQFVIQFNTCKQYFLLKQKTIYLNKNAQIELFNLNFLKKYNLIQSNNKIIYIRTKLNNIYYFNLITSPHG